MSIGAEGEAKEACHGLLKCPIDRGRRDLCRDVGWDVEEGAHEGSHEATRAAAAVWVYCVAQGAGGAEIVCVQWRWYMTSCQVGFHSVRREIQDDDVVVMTTGQGFLMEFQLVL